MSRNLVILLVVMCAAVAGLLIFPKLRTAGDQHTEPTTIVDTTPVPTPPTPPAGNGGATVVHTPPVSFPPVTPPVTEVRTGIVARVPLVPVMTYEVEVPDTKPLAVLEKEYAATTNRDERLDAMMDISEQPGPEAVRALARLFQFETDTDLKVDLLDSLLGIEGQVEEKLKMLTLGTAKGLPGEVRQSAIDGLIDLDDPRVIPVLNGLLNDPDEEIRDSAKDALEMLQSQPAVKLK